MDYTTYFYTTRFRAATRRVAALLAPLAVLALLLALLVPPSHAQIGGDPAEFERFGQAVASGDFDGDGFDDLAVGVPGENGEDVGGVNVIYGTANRLDQDRNQIWVQSILGQDEESGDQFGSAVASGDFNGDGRDDLIIGAPGEDEDDGAYSVIYGTSSGLSPDGSQFLTLNVDNARYGSSIAVGDFNGDGFDDVAVSAPGVDDNTGFVFVDYGASAGFDFDEFQEFSIGNTGDQFGFALAAGDFNADGRDDLAIGAPGGDDGDIADVGFMIVLDGSSSGLFQTTDGGSDWNQNDLRSGEQEAGDQFGYALAVGDFDGDGRDDVAVGIPFEDNEGLGVTDNGRFAVFYGSDSGVSGRTQLFGQSQLPNGSNGSETNDKFGFALAAGDFTGDGLDDLAISAPEENDAGGVRVGMVFVLHGSGSELTPVVNQTWNQGNLQPRLNGEDRFGDALASGDFNGDGRDDLAVGVPNDDALDINNSGGANVIYGTTGGLNAAGNQYFFQGSSLNPTSSEDDATAPTAFALDPATPNPFTEATQLRFTLATADHARLAVYDVLGRQVALLADGTRAAGSHEVTFDAAGLPAGLYVVRLTTDAGDAQTQRITVVR